MVAPRQLAETPAEYAGQQVLCTTVGCLKGDETPEGYSEILYKKWASKPAVVVIRLSRPFRGPLPPKVDGRVEWRGGFPVVVADAIPVW